MNIITDLKVVKVEGWKRRIPGGYELLSGWGVQDVASGRLYAGNNSTAPYLNTKKGIVSQIVSGGLISGFNTVPMHGAA